MVKTTQNTEEKEYVFISTLVAMGERKDTFDNLYDTAEGNNMTGKIYEIIKKQKAVGIDGEIVMKPNGTRKRLIVKFVNGEAKW